ncbi:hypothetical protein SY88_15580 [Clostridiales bacterium PH28_bin88]|nr:hypothetical protein SY88_15580 [Clostridiales bacterium PH28_bin88]
MSVEVLMPKNGMTMVDGTIVRWLKQEGDAVTEGEILLEVMTDKATLEIESPATGWVEKILHPEGAVVPIYEVRPGAKSTCFSHSQALGRGEGGGPA